MLDRWVGEVDRRAAVGASRSGSPTRVLAAEAALTADVARLDEADAERRPVRSAAIDAELREHAVAAARAAALRDRRLPALQKALDTVRAELTGEQPQ